MGGVIAIMTDHARRLAAFFGEEQGMRQMRKWCAWYTKGFRGSSIVRESLVRVRTIEQMLSAVATLDPTSRSLSPRCAPCAASRARRSA